LVKTDNSKSKHDFKVKTISSISPPKTMTPKHAHFAIDFYGKVCADKMKAANVLKAVVEVWSGKNIQQILQQYSYLTLGIPGYSLEYILYALNWIREQEDINFNGRSPKKQKELDEICIKQNIIAPYNRKGSQLAIALLCDIANGTHPVEALLKVNLDIRPKSVYR